MKPCIEFGYSVFSSIGGKNDFLNEISENDLVDVNAVGARIWILYPSFLFSNILFDPQRTGTCVKHRLAVLLQKVCMLQIKINSIYLYLLIVQVWI